jgi:hypothetical protein
LTFVMPVVELHVVGLAGSPLTRLMLSGTTLTVERQLSRRVLVGLEMGSIIAFDLVTNVGRMVWTVASTAEQENSDANKTVVLKVETMPDEAVQVNLALDCIRVALQRETTLEIAAFSESMARDIDVLVPPALRSRNTRARGYGDGVDFVLQTRDLSVGLLRGGEAFLQLVLAASRVRIKNEAYHTHVEVSLGSLTIDDVLCVGRYKRILRTQGDHTAELTVDTYDSHAPGYAGAHELSILARLSTVRFIVVAPVLKDISSYFAGSLFVFVFLQKLAPKLNTLRT